jgi:hypothetical protein
MTFNNILALLTLVAVIPGFWFCNGLGIIHLPGEILGATIAIWTLIFQHYFRKKLSE